MTEQSTEEWDAPAQRRWARALWVAVAVGVVIVGAMMATEGGSQGDSAGEPEPGQLALDDDGDSEGAAEAQTAAMGSAVLEGLAHSQVWTVEVADDGTVWAGTRQGLSWFDGDTWRTDRRSGAPRYGWIVSLAFGEDGDVWAATEGPRGLMRFNGAEWATYTTADGLARDFVGSVAVAGDGTVWASTPETVERLAGDRWTRVLPERRPAHEGVHPQEVVPVEEAVNWVSTTDDGTVWASTSRGLARWDGTNAGWARITPADGLASQSVGAVAVGDGGALWAATPRGLARRVDGEWTTFTAEDGLAADAVTAVATADDGTVWAGTHHGLSRWDGAEWTTFTAEDGLAGDSVTAVAATDDGTVWAGTHDGLSRWDGAEWTTFLGMGSVPGGG